MATAATLCVMVTPATSSSRPPSPVSSNAANTSYAGWPAWPSSGPAACRTGPATYGRRCPTRTRRCSRPRPAASRPWTHTCWPDYAPAMTKPWSPAASTIVAGTGPTATTPATPWPCGCTATPSRSGCSPPCSPCRGPITVANNPSKTRNDIRRSRDTGTPRPPSAGTAASAPTSPQHATTACEPSTPSTPPSPATPGCPYPSPGNDHIPTRHRLTSGDSHTRSSTPPVNGHPFLVGKTIWRRLVTQLVPRYIGVRWSAFHQGSDQQIGQAICSKLSELVHHVLKPGWRHWDLHEPHPPMANASMTSISHEAGGESTTFRTLLRLCRNHAHLYVSLHDPKIATA